MALGDMTSLTLPAQPSSVARARRFIRETAPDLGDAGEVAELLTSELVANAVGHAASDVTITVLQGPPVRVEVHDGLAATDAFRRMIAKLPPTAEVSSVGVRGLGIVHNLATRIGLDDSADGKVVVTPDVSRESRVSYRRTVGPWKSHVRAVDASLTAGSE